VLFAYVDSHAQAIAQLYYVPLEDLLTKNWNNEKKYTPLAIPDNFFPFSSALNIQPALHQAGAAQ
jgi:hypothetical protein